jgi:import inner membrane translocase subunit TIM21
MMNRVTVSGLRLRPAASTVVARCPSSTAAHSASPLACHDRNDNHSRNGRRHYATQHQPPSSAFASDSRRRAVTPFNDDGRVPWTELSVGEKTARAAQQTFNFGLVILGVALTVRRSLPSSPGGPSSFFFSSRSNTADSQALTSASE